MSFFSKVKTQLIYILTLCEPSELHELQISTPSNFRRGDYTIEILTEEQQAWIHEKALADASFLSTSGYRLTRSSLSAMSSLPGPVPEPFCERPRQVPPFPLRRCVSNPGPHTFFRQRQPIVRSQSTGNRLQQHFPKDRDIRTSIYAPRYHPVRIEALPESYPTCERSHTSQVSDDPTPRPNSFYSISWPSSDVLPQSTIIQDSPRNSRFRSISLASIHSLPNSRPTSLALPRFSCPAVYDQVVESDMSLVEPNSFYRDQIENLDESFLKEIQGKSAWSTRSSLCISERESYHKTDTEEESADDSGNERNDSDAWSLGSMMQEAIMVRERYHSLYA